jgi:hypothetical protein
VSDESLVRADTSEDLEHPGWRIPGVLVGLGPHGLAVLAYVLWWWQQRVDAPGCFPDSEGVIGSLIVVLAADIVCSASCLLWALMTGGSRFVQGFLIGWLAGAAVLAYLTFDVLDFVATLGTGCGGSSRTPFSPPDLGP